MLGELIQPPKFASFLKRQVFTLRHSVQSCGPPKIAAVLGRAFSHDGAEKRIIHSSITSLVFSQP